MRRAFIPGTAVAAVVSLAACDFSGPGESDLRALYEDHIRRGANFAGVSNTDRYMPITFKSTGCYSPDKGKYECKIVATFSDGRTSKRTLLVKKTADGFRLTRLY